MTDFDLVWESFPLKRAKAQARRTWHKLNPDTATVQAMLDALPWQKAQQYWWMDRGILRGPHFSTWLNDARWEDEPPAKPQPKIPRPLTPTEADELIRIQARMRDAREHYIRAKQVH